jgi:quinohemoprotein ethanol dehydrogenase
VTRGRAMTHAGCCWLASACIAAALATACTTGGAPGEAARAAAAPAAESSAEARIRSATGAVDDTRLSAAASDPANWLTYGGTYAEQRFSPLTEIDASSVARLGLVWSFETGQNRGHEATPLVVDGVLYVTGPWSVVYALDARSGKLLWTHDPQVPRPTAAKACCDVVNRGVALYKGRIYVGTLDGRLQALDAATGKLAWETLTIDASRPYTVTGAPRVAKGLVLIGNGGAEFGVRGYVSAYDAETGALRWRTYTVPGDPSQPFESAALERAAKTWKGGAWWEVGGGGTVWDSIVYDPALDKIFIGTGNGSPWSHFVRSPGGGDNLYLSSVLALDPATGEIVWYYQETPGDAWDYTATQQLTLADLTIDGKPRKVILHAPKNGFFYVIDRESGKLISAEKYAKVTWADRVDKKTGRPVLAKGAEYHDKAFLTLPATFGAHNWQPMSFNPKTGLVYIPAQDIPAVHRHTKHFQYKPGQWNTGTDFSVLTDFPRDLATGSLLAWDPVAQKERWRVPYDHPWNGGTLTTAGNLVFQGTADGRFVAYKADDGTKLWEAPAGTGVMAGPVTYTLDGKQYVSVLAGWGGVFALVGGDAAHAAGVQGGGRLLTFAIGGSATLPPAEPAMAAASGPLPPHDPALVKQGEALFAVNCAVCHGIGAVGGGVLPDLRRLTPESHAAFQQSVLGGRKALGMPDFTERLSPADVMAIHAYVLSKAEVDRKAAR